MSKMRLSTFIDKINYITAHLEADAAEKELAKIYNRLIRNTRKTLCPQCGPDVKVDDDGCCKECGATATGDWVSICYREPFEFTRADIDESIDMSVKDNKRELAKALCVLSDPCEDPLKNALQLMALEGFDKLPRHRIVAYIFGKDNE